MRMSCLDMAVDCVIQITMMHLFLLEMFLAIGIENSPRDYAVIVNDRNLYS